MEARPGHGVAAIGIFGAIEVLGSGHSSGSLCLRHSLQRPLRVEQDNPNDLDGDVSSLELDDVRSTDDVKVVPPDSKTCMEGGKSAVEPAFITVSFIHHILNNH